MLSELLDGGQSALEGEAGSLVNGYVSSPGSSLLGSLVVSRSGTMTLTSGTVTVVSDSRLNRLIAQGTTEDMEIIEGYLKIVDKDNSITAVETYGRSHVIELFNTRASEVAATIREAYAGRVSAAAGSRTAGQGGSSSRSGSSQSGQRSSSGSQQRSSSGERSGGESSGDRGSDGDRRSSERKPSSQPRSVEPKLTIAVHETSNSLIITAPDQLFKEVEDLVKLIDSRNEQTVRIITHANAGGVHRVQQQVLSGQSSSTSSPSRSSGSSPSRSSGSSRTGSSPSRSSSGAPRSSSTPSRTSGSSRGSGR